MEKILDKLLYLWYTIQVMFWNGRCVCFKILYRGIAQLVEQWSPKPRAEGSSPSAPAKVKSPKTVAFMRFSGIFYVGTINVN